MLWEVFKLIKAELIVPSLINCPKNLLNGPCADAPNGICPVNQAPCPWFRIIEIVDYLEGGLLYEHPLIRELEKHSTKPSRPRESDFLRALEKKNALSIEIPLRAFRGKDDVRDMLKVKAHLYTIPDNPLGYPHYSPTAIAVILKENNAGVMPHLTTKDRNFSAIAAELRTALLFEFDAVLLTTGDWPGSITPSKAVFDLDSVNLIKLSRLVFSGILPTGERFNAKESPLIVGTMNPNYPIKVEGKRVARKVIAGAEVLFTQVVAKKDIVRRIPEIIGEASKYTSIEPKVVVSLLYPLGEELRPQLEAMGILAGNSFEEVARELASLDINGVNLIVPSLKFSEWAENIEKALEVIGWR